MELPGGGGGGGLLKNHIVPNLRQDTKRFQRGGRGRGGKLLAYPAAVSLFRTNLFVGFVGMRARVHFLFLTFVDLGGCGVGGSVFGFRFWVPFSPFRFPSLLAPTTHKHMQHDMQTSTRIKPTRPSPPSPPADALHVLHPLPLPLGYFLRAFPNRRRFLPRIRLDQPPLRRQWPPLER